MSFRLETFIAFRYLKSRRDESFISISSLFSFLGITIGVATLIVVMSVMNGFRYELVNKIVGINGHIILYLNSNSENKHSKVSNDIEALEEVESVSKEVEMHAMISSTSNSFIQPFSQTNISCLENWLPGTTLKVSGSFSFTFASCSSL